MIMYILSNALVSKGSNLIVPKIYLSNIIRLYYTHGNIKGNQLVISSA